MHDIHVIDGGVHYARNGDVRLAYRVLGDGDTTLVWVPGWVSNVDLLVDPDLPFTPFFEQLAAAHAVRRLGQARYRPVGSRHTCSAAR